MNEVGSNGGLEETGVWQMTSPKKTIIPISKEVNSAINDRVSFREDVGVQLLGKAKNGQEKALYETIRKALEKKLKGFVALYIDSIGGNTLVRASLEHGTNVEEAQKQIRRIMRSLGAPLLEN